MVFLFVVFKTQVPIGTRRGLQLSGPRVTGWLRVGSFKLIIFILTIKIINLKIKIDHDFFYISKTYVLYMFIYK